MKVNFLSRHEKVKRRVADKVNYQNPYHIGKRQIWSEWLSLITIQTWPSLGKQISWSNWNLPKTTHSFPETALHTPFSFALMSGDQSNFLTTIQLLKCIFISGIIRLLNEVNFHVYIDSRFNNVLSDFRYCKSASLGLSNFEKENRTFTNKKKNKWKKHNSHVLICEEAHSTLFQVSRRPLPVPAIPWLHDMTCSTLQLF